MSRGYRFFAEVNEDGTVGSTILTTDDLELLGTRDGKHWKPLPVDARSRRKWRWVGDASPTGWEQRHHARVTVDDPRLEPDGESFAVVMVVADGLERFEDVALEINGARVLVDSETPLEVGRTTEAGTYRIRLVDPRLYGTQRELEREIVVL